MGFESIKNAIVTMLVIVVAVLVAGGIYFAGKKENTTPISVTETSTPTATVDTQEWAMLTADQSGIGPFYYPSSWIVTPAYGGSYGTANSIVGVSFRPSTVGPDTDSIGVGGFQYGCENVNVFGGNNPAVTAYCFQGEGDAWSTKGKYITRANQGNIFGIPMTTRSTDPTILTMFHKIIDRNQQPVAYEPTDINGKYMGRITRMFEQDREKYITVDYVEWLGGKAAIKAALEDNKCSIEGKSNSQAVTDLASFDMSMGEGIYADCAPNGYYVQNKNPNLHTFPIFDEVTVTLQTYSHGTDGNFAYNQPASLAILQQAFAHPTLTYNPSNLLYWITLHNGAAFDITEQYQP